MTGAGELWAVRCWHWRPGVDRSADADLAAQQVQRFRRAPSKALAHVWGRKLAAHPDSTSPGLYDVMRGVRDRQECGGIRWEVDEEVRP